MWPVVAGVKLINSVQLTPGASEAVEPEPLPVTGQAEAKVLSRVKLEEMLGSLPEAGMGKMRLALPPFSMVTVCGLSLLVAPKAVLAKPSEGRGAV
jgi:hypothetical protein